MIFFSAKTSQYCGFESEDICGFTQDNETDFFDWTRNKKRTPSAKTGPNVDHTCGNKNGEIHFIFSKRRNKNI